MDEDESDLNYNFEININFEAQKQMLHSLQTKYNLNFNKPSSCSSSIILGQQPNSRSISRTNSSGSQQSVKTNSGSITRTNSSSSQENTQDISSKLKTKVKDKSTKSGKSKSKYESVIVVIDLNITNTYGQQILNELQILEITYETKNQIYPNLITWCYTNKTDSENNDGFNIALLILNWKDIVDYISSNSLITHIKSIKEMLHQTVSLGIYGFENYFKYWKSQKQPEKQTKSSEKRFCEYRSSVKINRYELEYVLTELELRCGCSHRFLENMQDIVDMISQYTKSIVQLPEKLEHKEKYKNFDFCMTKDNRDCVMVDKNGNGLKRLWKQQLTSFDMVRLETAEAIMSKYPTPANLFDAYEDCSNKSEGAKLLENIPIRRAAGPITYSRKIGPELSNKIYNYLHATEGNTVI